MSDHKCHWMLDPPDGPESKGTCIFCNQVRTFSNVPPIPSFMHRAKDELAGMRI